jgi:hypothetical protein
MQRILPFFVCLLLAAFSTSLNSQNIFAPPVEIWEGFSTPGVQFTTHLGDIDGDGDADVVIYVEMFTPPHPRISIRSNDGTGRLTSQAHDLSDWYLFALSERIALADINGDGKAEVIVDNAILWYSPIDGQYIREWPQFLYFLAAGKVNADNHIDIIGGSSPNFLVGLNPGNGSFTIPMTSFSNTFGWPSYYPLPIIRDMTGDGKPDIVTFPYKSTEKITVFQQQEDGTFTGIPTPVLRNDLNANFQVVDFDRDGDVDIVFWKNNNFNIMRNTNNMFTSVVTSPSPQNGIFADFNMDGHAELLLSGVQGGLPFSIVHYNPSTGAYNNTGGYEQLLNVAVPRRPTIYDYDNDGDLDILASYTRADLRIGLYFYENLTISTSHTRNLSATTPDHLIFPQPFSGNQLRLDWKHDTNAEILIRNLFGELIARQQIQHGVNVIELSPQLPSGTYFYHFRSHSGTWMPGGKLVKIQP